MFSCGQSFGILVIFLDSRPAVPGSSHDSGEEKHSNIDGDPSILIELSFKYLCNSIYHSWYHRYNITVPYGHLRMRNLLHYNSGRVAL